MLYQLIFQTNPMARKQYRCIWCVEKIEKGELHLREIGKFDGDFQSLRWHKECRVAADKFFEENDEGEFEPSVRKRGSMEEFKRAQDKRSENRK